MTVGDLAKTMACINNLILALIKQANFIMLLKLAAGFLLTSPRLFPSSLPPFPDFAKAM
jgi:hypothetical protein